jgi:hypothetical protein
MPLYFFDIHNDVEAEDLEGRELPDLDAARTEAIKGARALIADSVVTHGRIVMHHSITVADEGGKLLLTIPFSDVVTIKP